MLLRWTRFCNVVVVVVVAAVLSAIVVIAVRDTRTEALSKVFNEGKRLCAVMAFISAYHKQDAKQKTIAMRKCSEFCRGMGVVLPNIMNDVVDASLKEECFGCSELSFF